MRPMRVVEENVLELDGDRYVRPPNILVMSGVHAVSASVNDPVVANDHGIHVFFCPTLTVATKGYTNGRKEV